MSLYQHLKREKEVADYVFATSPFLYPYHQQKEPPLAEQPKEGEREVRGQTGRKTWPFAPIV